MLQRIFTLITKRYKEWVLFFMAITGLGSGLLAFFPIKDPSLWHGVVLLLACMIVATVLALIYAKKNYLPEDDILIIGNEPKSRISFSFENSHLKAANKLAHEHYGPESFSLQTVIDLNSKNKFLASFISDPTGKFMGYFDMLPLADEFAAKFISGESKETDITPNDILDVENMQSASVLYFSGISVKHLDTVLGSRFAAYLVYAAVNYLDLFYRTQKIKNVYALAATPNGKRLLERLEFKVYVDEGSRKDEMDLYHRTFTQKDLDDFKRRHSFCDYYVDLQSYITNSEKLTRS